jgi:predicted dehydrogenase
VTEIVTGRTAAPAAALDRPRVGFLGVGWIGRHRMEAMLATGAIEAAAIADTSPDCVAAAAELSPAARQARTLEELLTMDLDGVVIATPSALHADQAIAALRHGVAVFCQKPLGRSAAEVRCVIDAARQADRLLAVDLSYRFTQGMTRIRELIGSGALGRVFAADLVFHNAYGPDKAWFYDPQLAGGGCVMDLGVHLVDLALWALGYPEVTGVTSSLSAGGEPLRGRDKVEDYGIANLELANGASVRIACSWRLNAGCDAQISAAFYGTEGGAEMRNVGGSFYDFIAERFKGRDRRVLIGPPDSWGGRAAAAWAEALAQRRRFDPEVERVADVAAVLDRVYAGSSSCAAMAR